LTSELGPWAVVPARRSHMACALFPILRGRVPCA
jgi:hypothetical protein